MGRLRCSQPGRGERVFPLYSAAGTVILLARTLPCLSVHQNEAGGPVPPCPLAAIAPTYPRVSAGSHGERGQGLCSPIAACPRAMRGPAGGRRDPNLGSGARQACPQQSHDTEGGCQPCLGLSCLR